MAYERDILQDFDPRRKPRIPVRPSRARHGRRGPLQRVLRRHREAHDRSGDAARPRRSAPPLPLEGRWLPARRPAGDAAPVLHRRSRRARSSPPPVRSPSVHQRRGPPAPAGSGSRAVTMPSCSSTSGATTCASSASSSSRSTASTISSAPSPTSARPPTDASGSSSTTSCRDRRSHASPPRSPIRTCS